ncbi:hypothetical protein [Tahibacter caeni]|uniref:hypothetical protein n=1 Tax=Tahibacter caeni TaxID=1453545 RepID=UPI002148F6B4|nr:hypothetical protein [Tahibacter caeni]
MAIRMMAGVFWMAGATAVVLAPAESGPAGAVPAGTRGPEVESRPAAAAADLPWRLAQRLPVVATCRP